MDGAEAEDAAPVDAKQLEERQVSGAIRTDLILSAEIMAIALSELPDLSIGTQAIALALVGIAITGADGRVCSPLVVSNVCHRNMGGGIGSMRGSTATIRGNVCFENFYAGIGHENASPVVEFNQCFGNIRAGIGISEGASPTVRFNECRDNRRAGIGIRTGANTRPIVERNDCFNNVGFSYAQLKDWDKAEAAFAAKKVINGRETMTFNLLPLKYQWAYDLYRKMKANHWEPEDIPMGKDIEQWRDEKMVSDVERWIIRMGIGYFSAAEGIVGDNIQHVVRELVTAPELKLVGYTAELFYP